MILTKVNRFVCNRQVLVTCVLDKFVWKYRCVRYCFRFEICINASVQPVHTLTQNIAINNNKQLLHCLNVTLLFP